MHIGRTTGPDAARPFAILSNGIADGAQSADGRIAGPICMAFSTVRPSAAHFLALFGASSDGVEQAARVDAALDALAEHIARHIDCDTLLALARSSA